MINMTWTKSFGNSREKKKENHSYHTCTTSVPPALINRKTNHHRKGAPAAASHVWSSILSDQKTRDRFCLIPLSQRRRAGSVTSAPSTPRGPSAPTVFVLVRSSAPGQGQDMPNMKWTWLVVSWKILWQYYNANIFKNLSKGYARSKRNSIFIWFSPKLASIKKQSKKCKEWMCVTTETTWQLLSGGDEPL